MRFPALCVFRECPDQRFFPIERGPDFEEVVELKVVRDIWVLEINTDAGKHSTKGEIFNGQLNA